MFCDKKRIVVAKAPPDPEDDVVPGAVKGEGEGGGLLTHFNPPDLWVLPLLSQWKWSGYLKLTVLEFFVSVVHGRQCFYRPVMVLPAFGSA